MRNTNIQIRLVFWCVQDVELCICLHFIIWFGKLIWDHRFTDNYLQYVHKHMEANQVKFFFQLLCKFIEQS